MKRLHLTSTIRIKEPISALSHLPGVFFGLGTILFMALPAATRASELHALAFGVYGTCMLLVFLASTAYHWLPLRPSGEKLLKRIDHSMIYLMIAGTYTPIGLIALKGWAAWSMLVIIWSLAFLGVALQWRRGSRVRVNVARWKTTVLYIVMGWVCIAYIYPITRVLPTPAIIWLAIGGICYTVGAAVYALRKPDPIPKIFGFHEIFHLLVLAGAASHLLLMAIYIQPMP